jgi:hypothetical protein
VREPLFILAVCAMIVAPFAGWVLLTMWLAARLDRKYREREELQRVFGKGGR